MIQRTLVLLLLAGCAASNAHNAAMAMDEIRAARAAINDAIARRDAEAIGAWLLPDYHVVTARGVLRASREASIATWTALFAQDPPAFFVRTPDEIHVNEDAAMAHENGHWTGGNMRGVYSAKWQRTAEGWRLQAEIFTPL